jgi:hypothetical protein
MRWAAAGVAMGLTLAACESTNIAAGPAKPQTPPASPAPPVSPMVHGRRLWASPLRAIRRFDAWRVTVRCQGDAAGPEAMP